MEPRRAVWHLRHVRRFLLSLLFATWAVAGPLGASVEVTFEEIALPAWAASAVAKIDPAHPRARESLPVAARLIGERPLQIIVLENEWLRVRLAPELGGSVFDAWHKPSGAPLFRSEGRVRDWAPYRLAGLQASFPSPTHGIDNTAQPAAWRVVAAPDGSVSVAFWMEFARHRTVADQRPGGRFSTLRLSHRFTLRPDEALLHAEYRLTNPTPWRQGRRLWAGAVFPASHPPGTAEAVELIFPTAHVSGPRGENERAFAPAEARRADLVAAEPIYGWGVRHGFAGVHDPAARTTRLVLFDPALSPGVRFAFSQPHPRRDASATIELWLGTDPLPHAVSAWLEAGETWAFRQAVAFVPGIGRPDFAHESFVLHLDPTAPAVELAVLRKTGALALEWNGRPLAALPPQAPGAVVRVPLPPHVVPPGRISVAEADRSVFSAPLPLQVHADDLVLADIRGTLAPGPVAFERQGESAAENEGFRAALAGYGEGSLERGRLLLRDGFSAGAERQLRAALARDGRQGEAWHLLGVALAEQGRGSEAREAWRAALAAPRPHPAAAYELAIASLPHDTPMAIALLQRLRQERPAHREAALLLAALLAGQAEGDALRRELEQEDPADPRVVWLQVQTGVPAATEELDRLVALEPGANRAVEEFASAVRGLRLATPRPAY